MNNSDFWASVLSIIEEGYTPDGLAILDHYAEQFINGGLVYKRFSPLEQHGCSAGGATHVVATILAGAENQANNDVETINSFKRELEQGENQAQAIEAWAKKVGLWIDDVDHVLSQSLGREIAEGGEAKVYDHGVTLIKSIGLDYYIQPILALDRISLHNAYFPETRLTVIGFGRDTDGYFKIVVEQPFIEGNKITDNEINAFMDNMGFRLINPKNWTFSTPAVYLSDMHDENVIKSISGNIFVVDCDIRINVPSLKAQGSRTYDNRIVYE